MTEVTKHDHGVPSWVDLATTDVDKAISFYSGLFGWEVGPDLGPEANGYRMFQLKGKNVAAVMRQPDAMKGAPPFWQTYITVDSADDTAARVQKMNGTVAFPPFDVMKSGRMATFQDTGGAYFSVWEPKESIGAEIINEPGALCWNELITDDAAGAQTFYGETLGWKTTVKGPEDYCEWKIGDRMIAGMLQKTPEMGPMPNAWFAYFAIENWETTTKKCEELGGSVVMTKDIPVGRFSLLHDPQGGAFAVIQLAETP